MEISARRELREETGFVAAEVEIVGSLFPNPALNTARVHIAVARGCVRSEERQLDPLERIDVELRPLHELTAMIQSGELCHAQAIAGFTLAGL